MNKKHIRERKYAIETALKIIRDRDAGKDFATISHKYRLSQRVVRNLYHAEKNRKRTI